jgi:aminopeptidase N
MCVARYIFCSTLIGLAGAAQAFTADHYDLTLRPDFGAQVLHGHARIHLQAGPTATRALELPAPNLHITRAQLDGEDVSPEKVAGGWRIPLTADQGAATEHWLAVDYQAQPAEGLVFGEHYVYTAFHTCHWMPCAGPALSRASIAITLDLPQSYRSVASGRSTDAAAAARHRWSQAQPYPLYTLGFAAGRFALAQDVTGDARLRFLGVQDDAAALTERFKESARVLAFLEAAAGVALPHPTYTQVLVPGGVAQEASSFSLIGKRMLDPILEDPQEDWVIAHEMAHQWWGNLITCEAWSDFWLNEGITVFMTAAWKQQRWGEAAYQHELTLARQRWQRAKDANFDKPLSWAGDYPNLSIMRAIHYSKGALFMHALREAMGEHAFWDGLRRYTTTNAGRSVKARDLQTAMEASAGRSLQTLFDAWVY